MARIQCTRYMRVVKWRDGRAGQRGWQEMDLPLRQCREQQTSECP
eukprot:CAMPEP_0181351426 /NCGR_PEP_ID=MMETSP1106-20121128/1782_1 /TAXON_ID=81844 /ORGANISM="Mantoniella antarctica, Strain SL-175" /LENGTH=44 /DNA_ID= /DNA_START= /DNA_END= /DNA_ORIENTATION=